MQKIQQEVSLLNTVHRKYLDSIEVSFVLCLALKHTGCFSQEKSSVFQKSFLSTEWLKVKNSTD